MEVTCRDLLHVEIKRELMLRNGFYCSFQNLLSLRLLSRSVKVKTYRKHLVLYGRKTWSRILREEQIFRIFENEVLRRTLGPETEDVTGEWRK
jgi:hypothetical protein